MSDEYFTTEDFINATRSPPLQPARPNYRHTETPPPLVDIDENFEFEPTRARGEGDAGFKSKSKKGPDYPPEIASKAAREFFTLSPEAGCEDRRPSVTVVRNQMLDDASRRRPSGVLEEARVLARAAFEASEKLNAALQREGRASYTATILQSASAKQGATIEVHEIEPELESMDFSTGFRQKSVSYKYPTVHSILSESPPPKALDVKPPPKVSLPAIRTKSPVHQSDWTNSQLDTIATSPALAKFTITPADGNPQQQLPKMQTSPARSVPGHSPVPRQTLPSLETALSQIDDSNSASYSARSSALSRPSPAQYSHFAPSPSAYSNQSPASAISPPRMPTHPSYWRTTGPETSNSTPSDRASAAPSVETSTPSSYFGHSPTNSISTPATLVPDTDSRSMADNLSAISTSSSQVTDGSSQYSVNYGNGSFKCNFPGCNAPPFQTQYLLNSHANVHSNTRPHFCPVQGCPRGPGGQGFKRKNEMIRHGLVHQSPGYVCPFCPDQQHKYPRPDNLQRHVRVHHVDKDRDDPLLRDVLAQRPEGGNRGRRRRLGS